MKNEIYNEWMRNKRNEKSDDDGIKATIKPSFPHSQQLPSHSTCTHARTNARSWKENEEYQWVRKYAVKRTDKKRKKVPWKPKNVIWRNVIKERYSKLKWDNENIAFLERYLKD